MQDQCDNGKKHLREIGGEKMSIAKKATRKNSIVSIECAECLQLVFDYMEHEGKKICFRCWIDKNTKEEGEDIWQVSLPDTENTPKK